MHSQEGTSIFEVIIATMLLGAVAVIVFSSFGIGLRAASLASEMNTATSIAEETIARLTAAPCGSSFQQATPAEPEDPRLARYRREVSVQRQSGANLWDLTVTVTWTQERRERSVTLAALHYISAACEFVGQ